MWTATNADRIGVDARRIVLAGTSAGGGLAITTSYRAAAGTAVSACGGAIPVQAEGGGELVAAARLLGFEVEQVDVPFADHGVLSPSDGAGAAVWRVALVRFALGVVPVG